MEDFTEEAPDATLAGVMTTVMMLISFLFREEAVLKLRTNLRMHLRRFMGLGFTSKQFTKERNIHAGNILCVLHNHLTKLPDQLPIYIL